MKTVELEKYVVKVPGEGGRLEVLGTVAERVVGGGFYYYCEPTGVAGEYVALTRMYGALALLMHAKAHGLYEGVAITQLKLEVAK